MSTVLVRALGAGLAVLGVLALLVHGLWPSRLGGSSTFVSTSGSSMYPGIRDGDLVVVGPAEDYRVGDVVAYRSDQIGSVVLHRVVKVADGRYTLRGDNNQWEDPEQVTADQIVGTIRARVPGIGRWLGGGLRPWTLAALLGALTYVLLDRTRDEQRDGRPSYVPRHLNPACETVPTG